MFLMRLAETLFSDLNLPLPVFHAAPVWRPGRISGVRKARRAAQKRRHRHARAA